MELNWMAWTWPTAIFFLIIATTLVVMTVLAIKFPERERVGILHIPTTRGDRLFITLLGSAFIHLGWLFFLDIQLWWALVVSAAYAFIVFRWV
ncbi:DUF2160 domain-containing protein [Kiloniella antarctica]|uniref:DUF2160 domain-containing protein n=1 Tax=Kiloniella antarctica TaxID=1550907 RepID=A0ABW5BH02_9PROT